MTQQITEPWKPAQPRPKKQTSLGGALLSLIVLGAIWWFASRQANPLTATQDTGWTKSPNYTTCQDWGATMTTRQQEAMAGDLVVILREQADSAASEGRVMAPQFATAITAACMSPEIRAYAEYFITAAAAYVFVTDQGRPFRP